MISLSPVSLKSQAKKQKIFDAIFCINLKRRKDRWHRVKKEFKKMGILGEIIRFDAFCTPENGRVGCAKSHLEILKFARDKKLKSIIIFEDDMKVIEESVTLLSQDLQNLSKIKWDMFYLGCQFASKIDLPYLISSNKLMRMGGGRGLHAIAYNCSAYTFLIDKLNMIETDCEKFINVFGAIDVYIEKYLHPKLKVYMVNNVVCEQFSDYSDINKKLENYHNMIVKNFYILKKQPQCFQVIMMFSRKISGTFWLIYRFYFYSPLKYYLGRNGRWR